MHILRCVLFGMVQIKLTEGDVVWSVQCQGNPLIAVDVYSRIANGKG